VSVLLAGSIARTRLRRDRLMTTDSPSIPGVAAPQRLVLPPCGTIATPAPAQARTTAATAAVVAGRTTQSALP
jgi:hypothetical protein